MALPLDAVHCECSLLATRSSRLKTSSRHPQPRSFSRLLETVVRKVFDSQREAKDLSPQKIDINEAPMTKLSRQSGETHITEPAKNTSPRVNGNAKLSSLSIADVRKQPALDSSSGTSDGSLNATYGTKNLEESVSMQVPFTSKVNHLLLHPKSINTAARPTILTHPLGAPLINYPRFHFPQGVPVPIVENDAALRRVCHLFRELPSEQVTCLLITVDSHLS
ncbi:unnamed protein product [Haemonchus placei]|uniref:Phosphofurin acidic cluster sorting protein 2 n=1 Tax=Haemonchus placei TaxID=6290 RepID=A0A0N4W6C4_HAEPC|nr:unnamed protein product [Haemonchus placei]